MIKKILPQFLKTKIKDWTFELMKPNSRRLVKYILADRHLQEQLKARMECIDEEPALFGDAPQYGSMKALTLAAVEHAKANPLPGLWLEFGVAKGGSINIIGNANPEQKIYGFDSFDGLPEDWIRGRYNVTRKGNRAQAALPKIPENAELVKGLFEDTLPSFLKEHPEPVAFVHIDCDLYSSAKCIFDHLKFQNGTVIVFNDYYNYPYWREGEHKAFQEFLSQHSATATCIGYCPSTEPAAFVLNLP